MYNDFKEKGKWKIFEITKFVIIKNFLFPLIFLGLIIFFKEYISYNIGLIFIIQAAVPPITAVPIVTERVGGNRTVVNQFIVASFVTSLLSIPLMIYLFELLF